MKKIFSVLMIMAISMLSACTIGVLDDSKNKESNTIELKNLSVSQTNHFLIDNEQKIMLTEEDIVLIDNEAQVNLVLNGYLSVYKEEIETLINSFETNENNYFSSTSLVIIPFIFSSSETDIVLKEIVFTVDADKFIVNFDLFSPEFVDMDLQVKFYIAEILKESITTINSDIVKGEISVFNTRNESNESVYYGKHSSSETEENTESNNEQNEGGTKVKMSRLSATSSSELTITEDDFRILTEEDITIVDNLRKKDLVLEGYLAEYKDEISKLMDSLIGGEKDYFDGKALIIVPFIYSSSEMNINLDSIEFDIENNTFNVLFNIYSPEYNDMDLLVKFYVVEILKSDLKDFEIDYFKGSIIVYNLRDKTDKSVYYGGNKND